MSLPAGYVGLLPILSEKARELGYALGLHGSLNRDMDIMAMPWTDVAVPAAELVQALADAIHVYHVLHIVGPDDKPHGRKAWCLCLGAGAVIDISIMPRVTPQWHVTCGKYDGNERSCNYASSYATFEEAKDDYDSQKGWHWSELSHQSTVIYFS